MGKYMNSMMTQLCLLVQRSTSNFACYIIFLEDMCTSRGLLCSTYNRWQNAKVHSVEQMQNVKFFIFPDWSIGQYRKI